MESLPLEIFKTQVDKALTNLVWIQCWPCFKQEVGLHDFHLNDSMLTKHLFIQNTWYNHSINYPFYLWFDKYLSVSHTKRWRRRQQFQMHHHIDFSQNYSYLNDRNVSTTICEKCIGSRGQIKHSPAGKKAKELCIKCGRSKIPPSFLPPTRLQASQAPLCPSSPAVPTCNPHIFYILHIPHL